MSAVDKPAVSKIPPAYHFGLLITVFIYLINIIVVHPIYNKTVLFMGSIPPHVVFLEYKEQPLKNSYIWMTQIFFFANISELPSLSKKI